MFAVSLQPDLKILAAGYASIRTHSAFFSFGEIQCRWVNRQFFGVNGSVMTAFGNSDDEYAGMTLQQDGKIVVCGYTDNGANYDFAVARYLSDLALGVVNFSSEEISFYFPQSNSICSAISIHTHPR
jgi:hypothetical protein